MKGLDTNKNPFYHRFVITWENHHGTDLSHCLVSGYGRWKCQLVDDESDEDVCDLDDDDIDFLESAAVENVELAIIQTDHVDDSFVPVAVQDDSKQPVLAQSVDSSSTVSVPCAAVDPPEKFSAAKAFASALHSAQGSTFFVTGDAAENADADESSSPEVPECVDFEISPLQKMKWTNKCKPPLKPVATKKVDYEVTVANGTPYEVYCETCSLDTLVELATNESNRYAAQQGHQFETNPEEIKAFFGILVLMGYHSLPSTRNHWSTYADLHVPYVTDIITVKRFEALKRHLHFNNNDEAPSRDSAEFDRAYKVRPVINELNAAFQRARQPELC